MKFMYIFSVLFFSMLLWSVTGSAQDDYMVHAIKKGETLSAIAKQFHSSVGDIMRLNGMNSKSKLQIGQKIKIPSTAVAASPKAPKKETVVTEEPVNTATTPSTTAQTHIVGNKETLYGISKKYKTSVADIQKWNNLKNTNIRGGQKLIVGYTASATVVAATTPAVETKPLTPVVATPVAPTPATVTTNTTNTPVKKEDKPAAVPVTNTNNTAVADNGFFASYFQKTGKEVSGDAATFKTASGWLDKKFYVLMNNVTEGTVVKVASNNKIVYARVLGPLPDIKEDSGLLVRISNAAASSLGINDTKFPVTITY